MGKEGFTKEVEPLVKELAKLHHPDWTPAQVDTVTPRFVDALHGLFQDLRDSPHNPSNEEVRFIRAMDRFNAKFPPKEI